MKDLLISILEEFCPNNVFLQGTMDDSEGYPENFITFWTNNTDDNSHFDNDVTSIVWSFNVFYYSNDPSNVNSVPLQIRAALKDAGFIPQGKGFDFPSDIPTHTGWVTEYIYREDLIESEEL